LLQSANLVLWIGPDLEGFLPSMLSRLPEQTSQLSLIQAPGLRLFQNRGYEHEHEHEDTQAHDDHHHMPGGQDPHIWLSVPNAMAIAKAIEQRLIALDPVHLAQYQQNGKDLQKSLTELDQWLKIQLKPYQHRPFMVFHDGYQYLEKTYGLSNVQVITVHPESPLTISQKRALNQAVQNPNLTCVFSEPQFNSDKVRQWLGEAGNRITVGVLDPLGEATGDLSATYSNILKTMTNHLKQCLDQ